MLETKEQARAEKTRLQNIWWNASRHTLDSPEAAAAAANARAELDAVIVEAKQKFGDNRAYPECDYCLEVSVFGGPDHTASIRCRSGRRNHCTCETCW